MKLVKTTLLDFDTVTAVSAFYLLYCTLPSLWEYYLVAGGKILSMTLCRCFLES